MVERALAEIEGGGSDTTVTWQSASEARRDIAEYVKLQQWW
jgi:hypothetical protein